MEHNQFGDYLDNVVVLKKAEDALNLQQQQVDGLRKQLQDMFGQLEPKQEISSDFDLSNGGTDCKEPKNQDGDYCKAMNALKSVKNGAVRNLGDLIAQIDGKTNLIITNKEKLVHAKEVLEKDSEEQAQITGEEEKSRTPPLIRLLPILMKAKATRASISRWKAFVRRIAPYIRTDFEEG